LIFKAQCFSLNLRQKLLLPHGVGVVSSDEDRKIESTNPATADFFLFIAA
jgi:hypothetical protein